MAIDDITLRGTISLRGGIEHPHAARRLREHFGGLEWQDGGDGPAIELREDPALAEGAFAITAAPDRVVISGGPFSGVIYGAEELIARGPADAVTVPRSGVADEEQRFSQ